MRNIPFFLACSGLLAACAPSLLPHSVHYLEGPGETAQVWRLDADGETSVQVTHEELGVQEFAVSPADGGLAIVSNNQLFLMDAAGENRLLIADESHVDRHVDDPGFTTAVTSPVFSPDGQTLAYALDGLHLYDLATGQDDHVLFDLGNLLGEPSVFAKELYSPGPWSPDGSKLLIVMGYFEGSTLAVMDLEAEQPYTRLRSNGPVCCSFSWAADGRSVLVANPNFTTIEPGLWRYDAETGEETVVLAGAGEDDKRHYVGWPMQLPSGDLLFFDAYIHFDPDVGIPLTMARSNSDGSNITPIRPEVFGVCDVLWSDDGSLALILQGCGGGKAQVVLARPDESSLQVLIEGERIRGMAWGP
jgi:Tol biopolymer transport system component